MTKEMNERIERRIRYSLQLIPNIPLMELKRAVEELFFNCDSSDAGSKMLMDQVEAELRYRDLW